MGSSSGNSPGDLLKRKRMQSNRESARRSRERKQKRVDDLTAQISQLRKENVQISSSVDAITRQSASVEADNSVLNAQMTELTERLHSLNEILNFINSAAAAGGGCLTEAEEYGDGLFNAWNFGGFNQQQQPPIMASAHMFN